MLRDIINLYVISMYYIIFIALPYLLWLLDHSINNSIARGAKFATMELVSVEIL